jgi:hypothetical protein
MERGFSFENANKFTVEKRKRDGISRLHSHQKYESVCNVVMAVVEGRRFVINMDKNIRKEGYRMRSTAAIQSFVRRSFLDMSLVYYTLD